jgi:perosamine synthetase
MTTTSRLAIDGGTPTVTAEVPPLLRWDDRERQQLAAMIGQPSLFYWNGPQTALLVERFRQRYPLKHVMACSSGTAALHVAVAAAGVGPGDEVITTPITDMGTVIGILYQQGVPVFADLEADRYNLDAADVASRITPRTKAILAVHLAGNPCDMAGLKELADEHELVLIEDCAQAWGATYRGRPVGTIGHIGCYSLNDFKHIGCGDGGIVASSDERFGPRLQMLADKAYDRVGNRRAVEVLAPNYRISEPQAAVAAVQLTRLGAIVQKRSSLSGLLSDRLADLPGILVRREDPEDLCSCWFYMFRIDPARFTCDRDRFVAALAAEGCACWVGYIEMPMYRYPLFRTESFFAGRWPAKRWTTRRSTCPRPRRSAGRPSTSRSVRT